MLDGFGKKVRHGLFHRSWSCERYGLLYVSYLDDGLSDLIRIPIELFLLSAKKQEVLEKEESIGGATPRKC